LNNNDETISATQLRSDIDTYLNQVDERFLKVVHSMLYAYLEQQDKVVGYRIATGEPVYASEAADELDAILEEVEQGDYITLEALNAQ